MITTSMVHNPSRQCCRRGIDFVAERQCNCLMLHARRLVRVALQTYGGPSLRIDALSSQFATSFANCFLITAAMRLDTRREALQLHELIRAAAGWHPVCLAMPRVGTTLPLATEGEFTMYTYQHLAIIIILGSATGLQACSSSSTPTSGTLGSGGSTSTNGSGGAGGGTNVQCHAAGTFTVTNQDMSAYVIDGTPNPTLTLCRGSTYVFAINATGHPFYITTAQGTGTSNAYNTGVTGNGNEMGNVTFVVDSTAPNSLFYDCSIHAAMTGKIDIVD